MELYVDDVKDILTLVHYFHYAKMKIEEIKDFFTTFQSWPVVLGTGTVLVISGTVLYKYLTKRKVKQWPKDTVILHQVGRRDLDLSLTPFGVKLETYFRMADIPYINNETNQQSSKKKTPWIEYNGDAIADSAFIIEYFNNKLAIDLNTGLSPTEKGIGRALCKMVEENSYWTMVTSRWYFDIYKVQPPAFGLCHRFFLPLIKRMMYRQAWYQGIGRHTQSELYHIMEADLQALSQVLGSKKFMFGDVPCEVDCCVFGQLSQFCWHMPNLYGETLVHETYPNLRDYCYRMKKAFWADLGTYTRSKLMKQEAS